MRRLNILLVLTLAGCVSPAQREAAAEARGYERGHRQAVQEHYWQLQERQRPPSTPNSNR